VRLKITHRTQYQYDAPLAYALQRIRLVPLNRDGQTVLQWNVAIEGATEELRYVDHFGNDTRLLSVSGAPHLIAVEASGEVEIEDRAGVAGSHRGFAPLWLFEAETELTKAGKGIAHVAAKIDGENDLERLHNLMAAVGSRVSYQKGTTGTLTTAEQALEQSAGVCQDQSHIFIAAARRMGYPARYVSGYLMMDGQSEQAAMHAWAEVHVKSLGWVGFDVANAMSPDERYVTIAVGRDYRDAMPVSGFRLGQADERLEVRITVEQ
jgi:transglutaminase-like putative cysteine protease